MGDSAKMNVWLHENVLGQIAANGWNAPKELLDCAACQPARSTLLVALRALQAGHWISDQGQGILKRERCAELAVHVADGGRV